MRQLLLIFVVPVPLVTNTSLTSRMLFMAMEMFSVTTSLLLRTRLITPMMIDTSSYDNGIGLQVAGDLGVGDMAYPIDVDHADDSGG